MSETIKPNKSENFVNFIIELIHKDTGATAALKRADNPATEYQSWEYLARFIDIEKDYQRLPYATIASALAKAKAEHNGTVMIGEAIARCYDDGKDSEQAQAKLRRLLACDSVEETCRVLRSLFSLINSRAEIQLDYAALLQDLSWFNADSQRTKAKWAQNFYRHYSIDEVNQ
jgi:CRISPR system Cascade subunit CasB